MRLIDADQFPMDARITWVERSDKGVNIRSIPISQVKSVEVKDDDERTGV